jgi:toxin YoeB
MFSSKAWEHYQHWQTSDGEILEKLNRLIRECQRTPFQGLGKPEPLRGELKGWWSRRLTREDRLIYRVVGEASAQTLEIAACRFHYG